MGRFQGDPSSGVLKSSVSVIFLSGCFSFNASVRQCTNSRDRMSPYPDSSTLKTSIIKDLSFRRMHQMPSPVIVCFSPGKVMHHYKCQNLRLMGVLQSRNAAVKLMHKLPSQRPDFLFTMPGMSLVSNSCNLSRMPFWLR